MNVFGQPLGEYEQQVIKKMHEIINAKCIFNVGDIVRYTDYSNCNTIYRVLNVKLTQKGSADKYGATAPLYSVKLKGVFGLFKQDYKVTKTINVRGGEVHGLIKLDLLALGMARNQFDLFIQQETKRLSGEE